MEGRIEIELADKILDQLQIAKLDERDLHAIAREALARELYERQCLSLGQTAELAGLERHELVAQLARRGMTLVSLSEEELRGELELTDAMLGGKDTQ